MTEKTSWLRLERPDRLGAGASLALRALLVLVLFSIAIAGHLFDRQGLRDNIDNDVSVTDVIYFTAITVATVGYGDIVPVTDQARMFDTFVVTPIRLFIWLIFLGSAYDFIFKRLWDRWRMQKIQRDLKDHIIVCGYGTTGTATVDELCRSGTDPLQIVVIDSNADNIARAVAAGCTGLVGDATHNEVLSAARVETAANVLVSIGRDDTAALVVLSARRLAPKAHVAAMIRLAENDALVRQAGANVVVNAPSPRPKSANRCRRSPPALVCAFTVTAGLSASGKKGPRCCAAAISSSRSSPTGSERSRSAPQIVRAITSRMISLVPP